MKEKILLIGGGGHCASVIDVIEQENKYSIAGIIDHKELIGKKVLGYEVIASDDELPRLFNEYTKAFITVGQVYSNAIRVKIFNHLKSIGYSLPSIISPYAYVSSYTNIGEGSIIMHHAVVNVNVKIGVNCIINSKALLEHDAIIEEHCHISTGTIINGGVCVKKNSFVGSNSTTREYITINGFIKAGHVST
jgi:sugar O-acyltransferase (sialic acid O-acetyltransferase NeuD family)